MTSISGLRKESKEVIQKAIYDEMFKWVRELGRKYAKLLKEDPGQTMEEVEMATTNQALKMRINWVYYFGHVFNKAEYEAIWAAEKSEKPHEWIEE